ncbi:AraC family transcriptional regulator [Sphingomonas sp. M1-B02]|uniref:AraC family transcriptional regulator n=1 Tax=Sphingomonas sp. M1-B02 TaxID=3114300 RepID=UPI00223EFDE4|nr:AraC family transcriptional regulator [Sphingomonas sp. S6-11]UZK67784.1 AraC family transcriptional regulator [Sphingomonas sp. S6-11]
MEFDVSGLPRSEQFAAWASALPAYTATTSRPEQGFEAKVRAWFLPPIVVTLSSIGPARCRRTCETAVRDGLDSLTFQLLLAGRMRGQAEGVPFRAVPGDVAVQDAALTFESIATRMKCVTVTMPRAFLDEVAPGLDVHGMVLRDGLGALLSSFLRTLPDALDGAELEASASVPRLLRDLLAASLPAHAAAAAIDARRPLRDKIRRYVAAEMHRPLSVDDLCAGLAVSRASLYRAFDDEGKGRGGVMAYVLEQRLLRARRLLTDPTASRSAGEVAAATAFRDVSELGRAYRRRFGITPGAARRSDHAKAPPAGAAEKRFRSWVENDQR